jgi:hypothetical protein
VNLKPGYVDPPKTRKPYRIEMSETTKQGRNGGAGGTYQSLDLLDALHEWFLPFLDLFGGRSWFGC